MAGSRANWEDMVMPTLIERDKKVIAAVKESKASKEKAKPQAESKTDYSISGAKETIRSAAERRRKALEEAGM